MSQENKSNVVITDAGNGKKAVTLRSVSAPKVSTKRKIKILWYSDFLRHTGFGNVAEEIVKRLHVTGKYEFEVIGINHHGDPYNIPTSDYYHLKNIPVWPAYSVKFPNETLLGYNRVAERLAKADYDIFFCLQDTFNLIPLKGAINAAKKNRNFRYVFYFPIDGDIKQDWVEEAVKIADHPITYTQFGKKKVKEYSPSMDVQVVPHGADLETFYPFETEGERMDFRHYLFGTEGEECDQEEFIITNVNRNQPRKDLPRTVIAFREFVKRYPEVKARLYLHCRYNDGAGHNLKELFKKYLPKKHWDKISFPSVEVFGDNGYPVEVLRKIYASADIITSTTLGEGWGMSTVEAMACGTPVVMPNNSATTEIIGANEERGYLADSGKEPGGFVVLRADNELVRPVTDVDSLVEKWKHVYDNREEAKEKARVAREWLKDYTWDKVADQWDKIFEEAYTDMLRTQ